MFHVKHVEVSAAPRNRRGPSSDRGWIALSGTKILAGAIQYVAVPYPVHLARPEQAAFHTGAGQDFRVPLSAIHPRSEEGLGGRGAADTSTCFT